MKYQFLRGSVWTSPYDGRTHSARMRGLRHDRFRRSRRAHIMLLLTISLRSRRRNKHRIFECWLVDIFWLPIRKKKKILSTIRNFDYYSSSFSANRIFTYVFSSKQIRIASTRHGYSDTIGFICSPR